MIPEGDYVVWHGHNAAILYNDSECFGDLLEAAAAEWEISVEKLNIAPITKIYNAKIQLILHPVELQQETENSGQIPQDSRGNIGSGIKKTDVVENL